MISFEKPPTSILVGVPQNLVVEKVDECLKSNIEQILEIYVP